MSDVKNNPIFLKILFFLAHSIWVSILDKKGLTHPVKYSKKEIPKSQTWKMFHFLFIFSCFVMLLKSHIFHLHQNCLLASIGLFQTLKIYINHFRHFCSVGIITFIRKIIKQIGLFIVQHSTLYDWLIANRKKVFFKIKKCKRRENDDLQNSKRMKN